MPIIVKYIFRLINTIRYLKWQQGFYRLWYPIKNIFFYPSPLSAKQLHAASSFPGIIFFSTYRYKNYSPSEKKFSFLNLEKKFNDTVDWNFSGFGKLWNYHLNYFEWLQDENLSVDERLKLIDSFIDETNLKDALDAYPISLRGIELIKFLSRHNINRKKNASVLYSHYQKLSAFPEYHLLGNHLLQNGFSLFFAAHYFDDRKFYEQSLKILKSELEEQILIDGGHFEKSPMYHCELLAQLLSCIQLTSISNRFSDIKLKEQLIDKAKKMLGWLQTFIFKNGDYAMMGDAAPGITPQPKMIFDFADKLNIHYSPADITASGYCKLDNNNFELLINTGFLQKNYQPGHIHADAGSFCLQVKNSPIIVDTGISTYEKNERRIFERSSAAHNLIVVNSQNNSEVWSSFRMGNRVRVVVNKQEKRAKLNIEYKNIHHEKEFIINDYLIKITENIKCNNSCKALLHLHFHPDVQLHQTDVISFEANKITVRLKGVNDATLESYLYADGFNKLIPAQKIKASVSVSAKIETEIIYAD